MHKYCDGYVPQGDKASLEQGQIEQRWHKPMSGDSNDHIINNYYNIVTNTCSIT